MHNTMHEELLIDHCAGRQFFEIETNRADVDWELFATEVVSEDLRDQLEKEVLDE